MANKGLICCKTARVYLQPKEVDTAWQERPKARVRAKTRARLRP